MHVQNVAYFICEVKLLEEIDLNKNDNDKVYFYYLFLQYETMDNAYDSYLYLNHTKNIHILG